MQAEPAAQQIAELSALVQTLQIENKLLRQKVQVLLKRLFGRKSEKLSPDQLELLLSLGEASVEPESEEASEEPPSLPRRTPRRERKPRLPENLPVEEVLIDPEEVKQKPEAYRLIGQEVTEELDVNPARYFRRRIIRRKYIPKADRGHPPIIAPLSPRLIEGSLASVGLLTDIVLKKYVDHLPLCRQEQILRTRYGINLSRKTMTDWVGIVAGWLKPVYQQVGKDLRQSGYLQVDETPVRYCLAEGGGSGQGYLWVYHRPGGDVLYEWHTSRAADCLKRMLDDFSGKVQCDGYGAYASYARGRTDIELAGCWAHARRKFLDAKEETPGLAGWFLHQVGLLYRIEARLRERGASDKLREVTRGAESRMILERIGRALKVKLAGPLPRSQIGGAIAYALGQWEQLLRYAQDGRLEIDNNLVENAIRPTALGKKNWMFVGHPEAGQRAAILYTLLESCKRRGINPQEYLRDVLARLPSMKITQVGQLTPANWLAARQAKAA